jgi:hypothetical protein
VPVRDLRTRLTRRAARAGVPVSADLLERLAAYYDLLERWNRKINLTALNQPDEALDRLLLEPLLAVRHLPRPDLRLIDIGSGGGSPAIPMKLALEGLGLTMVEAKTRKSAFLLARPALLESFGALSVRAVRVESRVLQTLQAFLAPGGVMMLFRGPGGPESPSAVVPPLEWQATVPLVDTLQSRLTLVVKRPIGGGRGVFHVEHD